MVDDDWGMDAMTIGICVSGAAIFAGLLGEVPRAASVHPAQTVFSFTDRMKAPVAASLGGNSAAEPGKTASPTPCQLVFADPGF